MIAIIQSGLANVVAYYRMFSYDVAWNETIMIPPSSVVSASFKTFAGLLDQIYERAQGGERSFLLGCHGNPFGLPLPLLPGTQVTANHDLLDLLTDAASGLASARSQLRSTVDQQNRPVFGTDQALDELLQKIRRVQGLHIRNVNFRACNLGAGPALRAIHRVLGASHTEAPKVVFVWSTIPTAGFGQLTLAQLQRQIRGLGHPQRIFSRVDCLVSSTSTDADDPAVAMSVAVGANARPTRLEFRAQSTAAIAGWTNSYLYSVAYWACNSLPPGGGYRRGGALPIIGLFNPNARFPVLFPGDAFGYLENIEAVN